MVSRAVKESKTKELLDLWGKYIFKLESSTFHFKLLEQDWLTSYDCLRSVEMERSLLIEVTIQRATSWPSILQTRRMMNVLLRFVN